MMHKTKIHTYAMRRYCSYLFFILIILSGCNKDDDPQLSTENKILSFELTINGELFQGQVDHFSKTISIETVGLESNTNLVPKIEISPYATISPSVSTGQNFNNDIKYTVTAQNGDKVVYIVKAENTRALSNEKKILSYSIDRGDKIYSGVIDHEALTIDIDINFSFFLSFYFSLIQSRFRKI